LAERPIPGRPILARTKAQARDWVRSVRGAGERVALVPTMGYLHPGHLSLVEIARGEADRVAMSIFVNPLQFGPSEDLDRYPRELDRDLELAREAGADLVFAPAAAEMYPEGEPWVAVVPERGAATLCGASRPGHFRGVLTVVAKLFGIFTPDVAVLGEKDFQQLALVRRMVEDLDLGVRVVGAPIVREADGLAMSSRNTYLSPDQRSRALTLSRALRECQAMFAAGRTEARLLRERMREIIDPALDVEYAEVVSPRTLEPVEHAFEGAVCALAARAGTTRLIDNAVLGP
jgi:pantoate--beta-alanine ligase